ncbi:MAG: transposase [Bacteroidota bacterium]
MRHLRQAHPSAIAIDSQSVKKGTLISLNTGIDGNKYINGRKRHFAVDTLGLPIVIHVSAANSQDGQEGVELLWQMEKASDRIELIRADQAYRGYFLECAELYKWKVDISQKPESKQGFIPKQAVGKSNDPLPGSISSADSVKTMRKP